MRIRLAASVRSPCSFHRRSAVHENQTLAANSAASQPKLFYSAVATLTSQLLSVDANPRDDHGEPMRFSSSLTALKRGERWYVVQTQPNREAMARVNLHRQGFRTFMPQIVKTVRHARRTRTVQAPLFPRYFFTPLDLDCVPWRRINGSLGVISLIMGGERPLPVPEGVVESLAILSDDSGVADFGRKLEIGSNIRILAGPFADQLARITHLDGQGRARVLLEIMGGARSIAISTQALISAGEFSTGKAVGAGGKAVGDGR
jgi:transcription antitermination factor NusG